MGERWYQAEGRCGIQEKWDDGHKIVMYVAPTGSGKTFLFTNIGRHNRGNTLYAAHRSELISQMSLALNLWGVEHTIIAPRNVVRWIVSLHYEFHKRSYYRPNSSTFVTSIQTLHKQRHKWASLLSTITLFVIDEGHHVLRNNIYGTVIGMMPQSRGLLATATCIRADGRGLGRHADGVVDALVLGPPMRTIIEDGFLNDFLVKSVPSNLRLDDVPVTKKGDYSTPKLTYAAHRSRIVGDVVDHYMEYARGKTGITFVTDAQTGLNVSSRFNNSGVPAEFISHKTPGPKRYAMMKAFYSGELLQLVNIDLFGEGYDLNRIKVVSCARPSKSYPIVVQQLGRLLRPIWPDDCSSWDMDTAAGRRAAIAASDKPYGLLLDHAGNYLDTAHGLPDKRNIATLDSRSGHQAADPDAIPVRVCGEPMCLAVFERILPACPYCGWRPPPPGERGSGPEEVDGRLVDLDPESMARLQEAARQAVQDPAAYRQQLVDNYCPSVAIERNVRRHRQRVAYQEALRPAMDMYMRQRRVQGMSDTEAQQRFYYKFGVDMLSAQSLPLKETRILLERVVMEGI